MTEGSGKATVRLVEAGRESRGWKQHLMCCWIASSADLLCCHGDRMLSSLGFVPYVSCTPSLVVFLTGVYISAKFSELLDIQYCRAAWEKWIGIAKLRDGQRLEEKVTCILLVT